MQPEIGRVKGASAFQPHQQLFIHFDSSEACNSFHAETSAHNPPAIRCTAVLSWFCCSILARRASTRDLVSSYFLCASCSVSFTPQQTTTTPVCADYGGLAITLSMACLLRHRYSAKAKGSLERPVVSHHKEAVACIAEIPCCFDEEALNLP